MADIDVARDAVEYALAAGASDADATTVTLERFRTEARDRKVTKLEESIGRSMTVRAFVEGRKATFSTSDFSREGLREFVRATVDAAHFVVADPLAGPPDSVVDPAPLDLQIYSEDVRRRDNEAKLEDARALEAIGRAFDPRITLTNGSNVADGAATITLVTSRGFCGSYQASSASRSANLIATEGDRKRSGSYGSAARSYAGLETVEFVAQLAARRAVEQCGARKPATLRCPVIFERDVAAHVLADVFGAVNAANVAVGNSYLLGKVGSKVGSDLVTIVDDGRRPKGMATAPFDSEGVPTQRTVVFERGVLETFLYDTYYGRKLGAASTGNASDGGIVARNFHLAAGTQSLEQLIATTSRGVLVIETIGFSTESVTGTYSRGARGFMIEGGELAYPIDEFTIAGNLAEMLGSIDAVADDLRFDAGVVSPSFRVAEMTVSGN